MIVDTTAAVVANVAAEMATDAGSVVVVEVAKRGFFATSLNGAANLVKGNPVVALGAVGVAAVVGGYYGWKKFQASRTPLATVVAEAAAEAAPTPAQ